MKKTLHNSSANSFKYPEKKAKFFENIFGRGADLTGYDNNYRENKIQCMNLWKEMKKWLINDVIVIYYWYLINNWHEKYKKEVTINIYIDKETVKDEFKNEIIQFYKSHLLT